MISTSFTQHLGGPWMKGIASICQEYNDIPRPWRTLSLAGALYTSYVLIRSWDFIWLHFLRPSDLLRYNHPQYRSITWEEAEHGPKDHFNHAPVSSGAQADEVLVKDNGGHVAWAVVTGATSGIGLGYATNLLDHGFNVVIHGRNAPKLDRIRSEFLRKFPKRNVETLIIDAEHYSTDQYASKDLSTAGIFDHVRDRFRSYNITLLINNLGGPGSLTAEHGLCTPHADRPTQHNASAININVLFPLELTRALLPILQRNSPSMIINIGSASGRLPMPLLGVHGAVKAFQEAWCASLAAEMRFLGHDGVKVRYDLVGMCATPGAGAKDDGPSWLKPDGEKYARSSLALGSAGGRAVVWGYWPHQVMFGGVIGWLMPSFVRESLVTKIVRGMLVEGI